MRLGLALSQLDHSGKCGSSEASGLIEGLKALIDLEASFTENDCLFLAVFFLMQDKTVRDYASECWSLAIRQQKIDTTRLGSLIGNLIEENWASPKRLAEVIENNLIKVSSHQNKELEILVKTILQELKTPVTFLKKLLEVYSELLAINNSKPDLEQLPQLKEWEQENNLKKVVKEIITK